MQKQLNRLLLLGVSTGIILVTVLPISSGQVPQSGITAPLAHFTAYFLLAGALMLEFHDTKKGHLEAFLLATVFGALMETVQHFLPYRAFGLNDVLINAAGAGLIFLDHHLGFVTYTIETEDRIIERLI